MKYVSFFLVIEKTSELSLVVYLVFVASRQLLASVWRRFEAFLRCVQHLCNLLYHRDCFNFRLLAQDLNVTQFTKIKVPLLLQPINLQLKLCCSRLCFLVPRTAEPNEPDGPNGKPDSSSVASRRKCTIDKIIKSRQHQVTVFVFVLFPKKRRSKFVFKDTAASEQASKRAPVVIRTLLLRPRCQMHH